MKRHIRLPPDPQQFPFDKEVSNILKYSFSGFIILGLTFCNLSYYLNIYFSSILHRMGVVLMKNGFGFNDLMQFGLFILALLTFIYLISH